MKPYCVFEQAIVGPAAMVGPFSRLRPGADVGEGAHVGNFVELKKTKLGKGAKANHLTYLGDATIGAGTNIGCGTITCNYDGEKKHPTVIGEKAFIGSDASWWRPSRSETALTSPLDRRSPRACPLARSRWGGRGR